VFSRIQFMHDRTGAPYPRVQVPEVTLKQVRGAEFYLSSTSYGNRPAVHVARRAKNLGTDPWNEDGRPPNLMFMIVNPVFEFYGGRLRIDGLEYGNMIWAGLVRPAYEGRPALKGVPAHQVWDWKKIGTCPYEFENLHRQTVVLATK
jgi:hypothetical protein